MKKANEIIALLREENPNLNMLSAKMLDMTEQDAEIVHGYLGLTYDRELFLFEQAYNMTEDKRLREWESMEAAFTVEGSNYTTIVYRESGAFFILSSQELGYRYWIEFDKGLLILTRYTFKDPEIPFGLDLSRVGITFELIPAVPNQRQKYYIPSNEFDMFEFIMHIDEANRERNSRISRIHD